MRATAGNVVAVFVGGMLGTGLRLGLDSLIPHGDIDFPVSTLVINVIGSFALGVLVVRYWTTAPGWLKAGLGPGLLGGFTTFSAVMVSLVAQAVAGEWWSAIVYLVATVALGFGAAAAGLWFGDRRHAALGIEVDE